MLDVRKAVVMCALLGACDSSSGPLPLPLATTNAATAVSAYAAVLSGELPGVTHGGFDVATNAALVDAIRVGSEIVAPNGAVQLLVSGLLPDTEYHFRVVGVNTTQPALGEVKTFRTLPATLVQWQALPGVTAVDLHGVSFPDAQTAFVVGDAGLFLQTIDGGQSWASATTFMAQGALLAVAFSSPTDGAAVGELQTVISTANGSNWTMLHGSAGPSYRAVSAPSSQLFFMGGDGGVVYRIRQEVDGGRFTGPFQATPSVLTAIHFPDPLTGWAVGGPGIVSRTNSAGSIWTEQDIDTTEELFGVHFVSGREGVVVGAGGTIATTTNAGFTWTLRAVATTAALRSVTHADGVYTIVGDGGLILRSTDEGVSWQREASGVTVGLRSVSAGSASAAMAVGPGGTIIVRESPQ